MHGTELATSCMHHGYDMQAHRAYSCIGDSRMVAHSGCHTTHRPSQNTAVPPCSFFRNVDTRVEPHRTLPVGDGRGPISTLKARSVIVDMECGVINEMLKVGV